MQVTVQKGDTLWGIAEKHLGDGNKWERIYAINRATIHAEQNKYPEARRKMQGPNWIFPGTKLDLPAKS